MRGVKSKQKKKVRKFIYETFWKKTYQMTEAELFEGIKLISYLGPLNVILSVLTEILIFILRSQLSSRQV